MLSNSTARWLDFLYLTDNNPDWENRTAATLPIWGKDQQLANRTPANKSPFAIIYINARYLAPWSATKYY
ncbi:hypothetical protein A6B36_14975 [Lactiplantibacillus plantarum]|nr:hypothetical protein [Lactiplantibacillus plantarum]MCT0221208.1 hypothetical protein [Lactiplantibacillus plantarum]MCT4450443.1 hypothetical protein [Lactiplantibacillus plantarum]MCT4461614.1 hypothetical protein [Lactiplantibacillus plantarum]OEZ33927.1 hypothetical protein A6B36_14975 [Lactiplantibacillus plantarum]